VDGEGEIAVCQKVGMGLFGSMMIGTTRRTMGKVAAREWGVRGLGRKWREAAGGGGISSTNKNFLD